MGKGFINGRMDAPIKESIITIRSTGGEFFLGQMEIDMRVHGSTAKGTERANSI
jgi:hypothetical protein